MIRKMSMLFALILCIFAAGCTSNSTQNQSNNVSEVAPADAQKNVDDRYKDELEKMDQYDNLNKPGNY